MEDRKHLILRQIQKTRNRLWVKQCLEFATLGLAAGAGMASLLALFSVFQAVPYLYRWEILLAAAGVLGGVIAALIRRPSLMEGAKMLDHFGLQERMVTALEFQSLEDPVARMQREDAYRALSKVLDKIRIPVYTRWRRLLLAAGLICVAILISLIPSPAKKVAGQKEQAILLAKETKKEIEKAEEELAKISESELTEEQLKELERMRQMLADSKASLGKVNSLEQAQKESAKAEYNFGEMSKTLVMMAKNSQGSVSQQLDNAAGQIGKEPDDQLAQNGGQSQTPDGQGQDPGQGKEGNQDPASQGTQGTDPQTSGQTGQGQSGNGENGQEPGQGENGSGQKEGDGEGSGSGENGGSGQNEDGSGQQEGKGSGQGQEGSGDGSGSENGQGEGDGSGQGEGSSGQSNGSGNGEGSGNGNNDGGGNGNGQGGGQSDFGDGENQHDYVSIPKKTGEDENLTGNLQNTGESEISHQQNGLSWEGEHVDGQAVIKEYAQKAYDGISQGQYPEGMEDVIKQYFNGF